MGDTASPQSDGAEGVTDYYRPTWAPKVWMMKRRWERWIILWELGLDGKPTYVGPPIDLAASAQKGELIRAKVVWEDE